MTTENRGATGIDKQFADESASHLNKVLEEGALSEDDFVVLDEVLKEKVASREKVVVSDIPQQGASEEIFIDSIPASEARVEDPVLVSESTRYRARLLFITKDISIMQEGSEAYRRVTDLRTHFLEIHIIVLNLKTGNEAPPTFRFYDNVWLYTTNSKAWWRQSYDAYTLALSQLFFGGSFRADIIIADNLFESGLAGFFLARKCEKPFQLHISEDFFDTEFVEAHEHPVLYEWSVEYLLNHATSIRTKTEFLRDAVLTHDKALEAVTDVLPSYYNLSAWQNFSPEFDFRTKYPQFNFIVLHISSMRTSSHAMEALMGVSKILRRYPTIGLIMVGNGPLRPLLEKTAITLEVQKQVEFEPMPTEVLSYMKNANVLIHLSEDSEEDVLILEASVAKLPIVGNRAGFAGKLLVDNQSVLLCDVNNGTCIANGINQFLSRNQDRLSFGLNASDIVFERIEQDYTAYLKAYAESIEQCMLSVS